MKQLTPIRHFKVTGKNSTSISLFGTLLLGLAVASPLHAATDASGLEPCLNYYTVGVSGCVPEKVTPTAPAPRVTPTVQLQPGVTPTVAAPQNLDTKIDDFLENHGKPPREFVAFYLEPTAENAMKWISKYNELIERNIQLTIAWEQAETLYKNELASGTSPSALVSSTLPAVPNFGVVVPGFTDNPNLANASYLGAQSQYIASPSPIPGIGPNGVMADMPLAGVRALAAGGSLGGGSALPVPLPGFPATTPAPVADAPLAASDLTSDLTYYYSAVCPYCKKFTPELEKIFTANPNLTLTCVDLTPHEVGPQTAPKSLPCNWRLPDDTELTARGVRQTPTLLIKTEDATPLKISGYVDEARLQSYLNAAGLLVPPAVQ